jgi:hypothetical protein
MAANFKSGQILQKKLSSKRMERKIGEICFGQKTNATLKFSRFGGERSGNILHCTDGGEEVTLLARKQSVVNRTSIATKTVDSMFSDLERRHVLPLKVFFEAMDSVAASKRTKLVKHIQQDLLKHRRVLKEAFKAEIQSNLGRQTYQLVVKDKVGVVHKGKTRTKTVLYVKNSQKLADALCADFFPAPFVKGHSIHFSPHVKVSSQGAKHRENAQIWLVGATKYMDAFCSIR